MDDQFGQELFPGTLSPGHLLGNAPGPQTCPTESGQDTCKNRSQASFEHKIATVNASLPWLFYGKDL
jgi:hypothetical protein